MVKGERKEEKEEKEKEYFRSERTYGSFYRRVPLPEEFDATRSRPGSTTASSK